MTEAELFFRLSSALHNAMAAGHDAEAAEYLDDILVRWLHGQNLLVRARCEALLEAHGMRAEMDDLCDQWAAQ